MWKLVTRLRITPKSILHKNYVSDSKHITKEVEIPVPWGHVSGKWWNYQGTKSPPVLALHGWLDNAATFDRLIPLLSPHLSILALDAPGHGRSSPLPKGMYYDVLKAVMVLKRVVNHYGWSRISLMGHSLGGVTCFLYSGVYNDEVDKLVLLDILTPIPEPSTYIKQRGKPLDMFLKYEALDGDTAPLYTFDDLTKAVVKTQDGGLTEETARILLQRGTIRTPNGMYRLSRDIRLKSGGLLLWSENEVMEFCSYIKANVLCLKADSSSYYFKKETFYKYWGAVEKSAKQATFKLVSGKHHVHLQDPQNISQFVNDFLSHT